MTLKLNMERAYDMMRWEFIETVMSKFGFAKKYVNLVMGCIREPSFVGQQDSYVVVQVKCGSETR